MQNKKKVFIIAAEISGDILGSEIMRVAPKEFSFIGVGGSQMQAAGLKSLFPISDLAMMGIGEILKKIKTVFARIDTIADAIIREKPDVVLTVDSSSLAVRVIRRVKRAGIPTKFYHVVAPMVWAWGPWRAKKYPKFFDRLFCFFDFEKPYFTKYGLDVTVIGFPVYAVTKRNIKRDAVKKYFTLLPGSRMGEVMRMMDVYKDLAAAMPEHKFAIPVAETTKVFVENHVKSWKVQPKIVSFNDRYSLYSETKLAVAVIGTATAELAIIGVPAVVVNHLGWLERMLVRIKYKALVNIISKKEIYPELGGKDVTVENIVAAIRSWDEKKIISELAKADKLWHKTDEPMKLVVDSIKKL